MPNVSLSHILNAQVVKDNGDPASGWKIFCYVANSSTPQPAYTDSSGTAAQPNPIILDASGFPAQGQIWLIDGALYKFVLTDENDVLRRTFNDISGVNDPAQISGEQWLEIGTVATFLSANSFSLVGDQVTEYHVGRRVQLRQGSSFVYGYITASSFSVDDQLTTVTVKLDNAAVLTTALSQSNLSLLRADHHALPKIDYELSSLQVDSLTATTANLSSATIATLNMTGAINRPPQVTVASASTTNLFPTASDSILVTGTTTINSFGIAPAGIVKTVEFQDALTLTYNATSMQLPGGSNIAIQAGDVLVAYSKGGGNWKVIEYTQFSAGFGNREFDHLYYVQNQLSVALPAPNDYRSLFPVKPSLQPNSLYLFELYLRLKPSTSSGIQYTVRMNGNITSALARFASSGDEVALGYYGSIIPLQNFTSIDPFPWNMNASPGPPGNLMLRGYVTYTNGDFFPDIAYLSGPPRQVFVFPGSYFGLRRIGPGNVNIQTGQWQ